jgi:hypothetical protein
MSNPSLFGGNVFRSGQILRDLHHIFDRHPGLFQYAQNVLPASSARPAIALGNSPLVARPGVPEVNSQRRLRAVSSASL